MDIILIMKSLFKYIKKNNKKVVWTFHDCWPFTGHSAHFTYPPIHGWNNGIHECIGKTNYPKSYLIDGRKRNSRIKVNSFLGVQDMIIVTPSNWLKELVQDSFLNCYDVKIINNGINTNMFKYTESMFRSSYNIQDKFVILGVSNVWDVKKGLYFFLELSKKLQKG